MYFGSPSLIYESLMSVLDSEPFIRCMSHDDINKSVPDFCAIFSAARKWRGATEYPDWTTMSIPD